MWSSAREKVQMETKFHNIVSYYSCHSSLQWGGKEEEKEQNRKKRKERKRKKGKKKKKEKKGEKRKKEKFRSSTFLQHF